MTRLQRIQLNAVRADGITDNVADGALKRLRAGIKSRDRRRSALRISLTLLVLIGGTYGYLGREQVREEIARAGLVGEHNLPGEQIFLGHRFSERTRWLAEQKNRERAFLALELASLGAIGIGFAQFGAGMLRRRALLRRAGEEARAHSGHA